MSELRDLKITRLCADAMGYSLTPDGWFDGEKEHLGYSYDPLLDDAQAMALVKRFPSECYEVFTRFCYADSCVQRDSDLNRAICERVAKMQAAK